MKVTIEIDCTPEEARTFFGLPDLSDLQQAVSEELMEKMRASMGNLDPESLMKTWFSGDIKNWEQLQKSFWSGGKEPE